MPPEAARIADAYAFEGPALDLGALLWDGDTHPPSAATAHRSAPIRIPLSVLNRHGLVAGATGTGKTKTLQLIAEQLSAQGVPVFVSDIKGDVSGILAPGADSERVRARAEEVGQEWTPTAYPAEFYTLGGKGTGIPVRATVTSFGPTLLAKVLGLNDTQEQSLGLVFHYADHKGLELIDIKDLRAVIQFLTSDEGKEELNGIGGLSKATAGVLLRSLVTFENEGAEAFFGEPDFDTADLIRKAVDGRGIVSVMELAEVRERPRLFSTFLMWLLADLFHNLPEAGDLDKPKLVFFLDEAHLLFNDASKAFLESITQTVRLIRSKGVGVFFVTQSARDVPSDVLGQLGNRIQHPLRAFTPEDQKALKSTVKTFPESDYDLGELLTGLGTGEAVVTVLSEKGAPTPVAATRLRAPQSLMGPVEPTAVQGAVSMSLLVGKYFEAVDRESAYEKLTAARQQKHAEPEPEAAGAGEGAPGKKKGRKAERRPERERQPERERGAVDQVISSPVFTSLARSVGSRLGREINRSLFGTARRRRKR
ncbi:helicase HerA-like domain-containing protein [Wenjunlia tyrosinilytica]|uniref:helicase HerA-like domain-containing protein n=1 Tax=Wenjunlia tyrosinilytica TaxID=1544741 RepID=UPI001E2AD797|nr:helicase HerA-like domain-containing protein [Wenjunlia tyrosinilytica]